MTIRTTVNIYPCVFVIGCPLMMKIMKPKESTKKMLKAFMICGFFTIFFGLMFGGYFSDLPLQLAQNWFGVKAESLPELPFVFKLRDNEGNIYENYEYTTFTKNRYTYLRVAFAGVDLFKIKKTAPTVNFPLPNSPVPDYIYKGALAAEYASTPIEIVYVDSYYVGNMSERFAEQITLYRADRRTENFDYKNQRPKSATSGLVVIGKEE